MAGLTDNINILKAINQVVKAINDLIASSSENGNETTVNVAAPSVTVAAPSVTVKPNITVNCNCGCGGGSGGYTPPADPADPTDPTEETPPDGFGTWGEYNDYKCRVSNWIVDGLARTLGIINSFSGTSSFVSVVGIIDVALKAAILEGTAAYMGFSIFVGLASTWYLLGAALLGLAATGFIGWIVFSDVVDGIEENRQELICALKNSTPSSVLADFMDVVHSKIIDGWATEDVIADIIEWMLPTDTTNKLFVKNDDLTTWEKTTDCDGCGSDDDGYTWDFSINSNGGTKSGQEAFMASVNGIATSSYDGGGHWWGNYGPYTTMKLIPGKDLVIPGGTIVKIWWENAEGSAQGVFEQYQVSQNYGYFPGPNYGGSSPSEVAINRDWATSEIFLTPTLGALRITKIVIVGVH